MPAMAAAAGYAIGSDIQIHHQHKTPAMAATTSVVWLLHQDTEVPDMAATIISRPAKVWIPNKSGKDPNKFDYKSPCQGFFIHIFCDFISTTR